MADALTHRGGTPTVHGRWEALHVGQGSISLEYQTCTSPHPFDTLVTGMSTPTLLLSIFAKIDKSNVAPETDSVSGGEF